MKVKTPKTLKTITLSYDDKLKAGWAEGKTAEAIIDEHGCGNSVSREDAIAWLESQFITWKSEDDYYEA